MRSLIGRFEGQTAVGGARGGRAAVAGCGGQVG